MATAPNVKVSCFAINIDLDPTGILSIWAGNQPSDVGDPPKYQTNPNSTDTDVFVQVLRKLATAIKADKQAITVTIEDGQWIVKDP
jgi:hypothetical protein